MNKIKFDLRSHSRDVLHLSCIKLPSRLRGSVQDIMDLLFDTFRPTQNGCYFGGSNFTLIFVNKNYWIFIPSSLKSVPYGEMKINQFLVQKMAWRQTGKKPLSPTVMLCFIGTYTHVSFSTDGLKWLNRTQMKHWINTIRHIFSLES